MPTTPRPATAGPMSRPSWPSTMSVAMTAMNAWSTWAPRLWSVSMRLRSSTALSSCAVPSVASRSSSALTIPWTKIRASQARMSAPTMMAPTARIWLPGGSAKNSIRPTLARSPPGPGESQGAWTSGRRAPQPDRDGGGRLASLRRKLRDPPRREAERRPPDVDGSDDVPSSVMDRRRDGVQSQLVLADRRRVAAAPDAGEFLEQRLELHDGALGECHETATNDAQHLAFGERRHQDLAGRHAVERHAAAGPVADRDQVRAVGLGDSEQRIPVHGAQPGRLMGQSCETLQLRHGDAAQVEGPLGPLREPDHDQAEPVLAG